MTTIKKFPVGPFFLFVFLLTIPSLQAGKEKILILKKDGNELMADRLEIQGNLATAYIDQGKIILPANQIKETRKVIEEPKVLVRRGKPGRVVFENPETFSGTTAHFKLYSERERVDKAVFQLALENLDKVLNAVRPHLLKLAWKGTFTMGDARYFTDTMSQVLRQQGFIYQRQSFLSKGLAEKKLDCDLYSLVFLSAAEFAGMRPGTLTFLDIMPEHDQALKVLSQGKYVAIDEKNIGHSCLRFYLNPREYAIVETTNGQVFTQPMIIGDQEEEFALPQLQEQIKGNLSLELCQKAHALIRKEQFEEGIRILESASHVQNNESVRQLLILAYIKQACLFANQGKESVALGFVQKVLSLDPQHSYALFMKKSISAELGKPLPE